MCVFFTHITKTKAREQASKLNKLTSFFKTDHSFPEGEQKMQKGPVELPWWWSLHLKTRRKGNKRASLQEVQVQISEQTVAICCVSVLNRYESLVQMKNSEWDLIQVGVLLKKQKTKQNTTQLLGSPEEPLLNFTLWQESQVPYCSTKHSLFVNRCPFYHFQ